MKNLLAIIENDSEMFIGIENGDVFLTNNIQEIITFNNIQDAKTFAGQILENDTCYDIVNITIKTEILATINY
ncbi:MAG: hypothetical protein LIR50_03835 [Bacillota bacterium]|nr:hypothetical protein [Bacillota bacterium]